MYAKLNKTKKFNYLHHWELVLVENCFSIPIPIQPGTSKVYNNEVTEEVKFELQLVNSNKLQLSWIKFVLWHFKIMVVSQQITLTFLINIFA